MKLHLPSLDQLLSSQKQDFNDSGWGDSDNIFQVVAPYRICPLGAHVDHQGGRVLGRTINAYSLLTFSPSLNASVRVRSLNFNGEEVFSEGQVGDVPQTRWGRYLRGAVTVLKGTYPLENGLIGQVYGSLPGGGLSSSASVGLAYLQALAFANGIDLQPWEAVELDRLLENDYLGLENGILDQSMIALGRAGEMFYLDAGSLAHEWVKDPIETQQYAFLIVYSGYSRALVSTGFNDRVGECRQAARHIGELHGIEGVQILSDVPREVYERYQGELPEVLRKRAAHYFTEVARVDAGQQVWERGDMAGFGQLMNESCHSSITQYESGFEPIIHLHEIFSGTSGVLGSRFGGGGYGGCVIGLVERERQSQIAERILEGYLRLYPDKAEEVLAFLVEDEGGVRVIV